MSGDHQLSHHNSPISSAAAAAAAADWQFGNQSMSMALPNYPGIQPQVSMADSFYPNNPYNSNPSNPPNPAFAENVGKPLPLPPRLDMGMFLPTTTAANPGILPPAIADFPADSSFVERAAKFSSFSAGNFSALVNPFAAAAASESLDHGLGCESPAKISSNRRDNGSGREETPDVANVSGDSSSRGLNAKKRKKSGQDMELDQAQEGPQFSFEVPKENAETKQNVECSSSTAAAGKSNGKSAKGGGSSADGAKQDYIHVRARRGQATNSHSLAERVRRERISERMKYLQDLVPGCSKVTGKAVMLDEIINYVQSLQRQVEFLSMKLATVNPSIDINIEELSKDPRAGPSSMGFLPDLIHPQLLPPQQGLVPTRISGMENHAEALRRAVNAQFTAMNGLKEPTTQKVPRPPQDRTMVVACLAEAAQGMGASISNIIIKPPGLYIYPIGADTSGVFRNKGLERCVLSEDITKKRGGGDGDVEIEETGEEDARDPPELVRINDDGLEAEDDEDDVEE